MKIVKVIGITLLVYVGIVAAFESMIGYFQPTAGEVLVITTFDPGATPHDRVVSRLASEDRLYVAANHWPRAWYKRALQNADVRVAIDGAESERRAVPVTGAEHDRVDEANPLPFFFRVLTGFPPRTFLRLDPR